MASLLDRIQQLGASGAQSAQRGIEEIIKQKHGKATTSVGPATSTLGEQQSTGAVQQATREQSFTERLGGVQASAQEANLVQQQQAQQKELQQQADLQQQRLATEASIVRSDIEGTQESAALSREAGTKSKIRALNNQAEQQLRDLASTKGIAADEMFSQYNFDIADLEDREDAAQLEQQAFLLAMQDKKYLEELEQIGIYRQLQNEQKFAEELSSIVMEQSLSNTLQELGFRTGQDVRSRDFQEELAKIDIFSAIDLANSAVKDEMTRKAWESGGAIANTLVSRKKSEE